MGHGLPEGPEPENARGAALHALAPAVVAARATSGALWGNAGLRSTVALLGAVARAVTAGDGAATAADGCNGGAAVGLAVLEECV